MQSNEAPLTPDSPGTRQDTLPHRLLFERNPLPMLVYDRHTGRLLYANQAAARCYGHSVAQLVELHLCDIFHPQDWADAQQGMQRSQAGQLPGRAWRHQHRDGNVIHVELDTEDIELNGMRARIVLVRDVTQERNAEVRLQQEHERLNAIVNASNEAIISTDAQGLVQTFNPGAERVFGISAQAMQGRCIDLLLPERFRQAHARQRTAYACTGTGPRVMGLRIAKGLCADGREIDVEGSIAQVQIGTQTVLIATLRDMTALVAANAERQAARTQLSQLTHRLMSQEKDLVKRIARLLHDQLGQTMAAIRLIYESMNTLRPPSGSLKLQRLDRQMQSLIEQAIQQMRVVLVDLHPPMLDAHGLAAALDNEIRTRALRESSMHLVFEVAPHTAALRWESACEYAVFMIAREALENAIRHSGATRVLMSLQGSSRDLLLEVCDNGRGMLPGSESTVGHLGMAGIIERAKSIEARLEIGPAPDGGTCIRVHWEARA
jgi:PAS domain S-box-containing protein